MSTSANGRLQVGIVGVSRGNSYLRLFSRLPETRVYALCDQDASRVAAVASDLDVPHTFTDYSAMLEADVDVVVVCTPMHLHAPMAIQALDRNRHVLSEVTAATDLQQCCALVDAVIRSRAKYMLAENYGYIKANVLVRELVRRGFFGEIYYAEGEYLHELKELCERTPWRKVWQTGRRGCTYPTHSLGPLLEWFDDRLVTVNCIGTGQHTDPTRHRLDDTTLLLGTLARGGLVRIRFDMLSNRPHNLAYYALQGTRGCYEASRGLGDDHKIWLADFESDPNRWHSLWEYERFLPEAWRTPPAEAGASGHWGSDYFVVRAFVDAILGDTAPPIDVYRALDYTVPGLVSEFSIVRGGVPVPVPDFRNYQPGSGMVPLA